MVLVCTLQGSDFIIEGIDIMLLEEEEGPIETGLLEKIKQRVKHVKEESISNLFRLIPLLGNQLLDNISEFKEAPSEISCEFSLGFSIEGKIVLVNANLNSNIKVKIKWNDLSLDKLKNSEE